MKRRFATVCSPALTALVMTASNEDIRTSPNLEERSNTTRRVNMIKRIIYLAVAVALVGVIPAWAGPHASGLQSRTRAFDVRIIKRGATFHGTGSVNVSPKGRLFATETDRSRIIELNPNTGEVLMEIGPADGVFGASDLDFDTSGNTIYWNNFLSGEVYKRNLLTGVSTQLAALNGIVDSLAINHQGRLFAAQVAPVPALWEIDPQGANPPQMIATVVGMDGIDTGPDGHVYTPDFFGGSGEVRRVNVSFGSHLHRW